MVLRAYKCQTLPKHFYLRYILWLCYHSSCRHNHKRCEVRLKEAYLTSGSPGPFLSWTIHLLCSHFCDSRDLVIYSVTCFSCKCLGSNLHYYDTLTQDSLNSICSVHGGWLQTHPSLTTNSRNYSLFHPLHSILRRLLPYYLYLAFMTPSYYGITVWTLHNPANILRERETNSNTLIIVP